MSTGPSTSQPSRKDSTGTASGGPSARLTTSSENGCARREVREMLNLKLEEVPKTYTVLTRNLERLGDEGHFAASRAFFWILAEAGIQKKALDAAKCPS